MADKSTRATCWSVTINNPTEEDELEIQRCRAMRGWSCEGQKEVGENGTPHYQLMVKSPQVRFAAVKKMFGRAHIEVARAPKKLEAYVHKEDTRVAELPGQSQLYPSQSTFWELLYEQCVGLNVVNITSLSRVEWWEKEFDRFGKDPMKVFDQCVFSLISKGYFVEHHAMNPQVRGAWKAYALAVLHRTRNQTAARRTVTAPPMVDGQDRQTTAAFDLEQSVSIPITNADSSSRSSSRRSSSSSGSDSSGSHASEEGNSSASSVL